MPLQATSGAASYDAFGGGVPVEPVYIEQIFQTYLYTGNGSTQTITNGVDLLGKGGLVWIKSRMPFDASGGVTNHNLITNPAAGRLQSNTTAALGGFGGDGFTSTGFQVSGTVLNSSTSDGTPPNNYASWTFRKQPKFFDVVTYTGDGTNNRAISHNLGSTPGFIIVKTVSTAQSWICYHTALGTGNYLSLNSTSASAADANAFPAVSSTTFTPTANDSLFSLNTSGVTFVAYLYAHNAGGFGLTGTDNVISCGSYTGNGSTDGPVINLGYEPQWLLIKSSSASSTAWTLIDNMRGMTVGGADAYLKPNSSDAETTSLDLLSPTATGFKLTSTLGLVNGANDYIYIAIRRGPMKVPTSGTSVYNGIARTGTGATVTSVTGVGFSPDFLLSKERGGTRLPLVLDRLRGVGSAGPYLNTSSTSAESSSSGMISSFDSDGFTLPTSGGNQYLNASGLTYINWMFRRAPSFFDEVCYSGNSTARTINHNLGVAPELMIVKARSGTNAGSIDWFVYASPLGNSSRLLLNTNGALADGQPVWNSTTPTSSVFSLGTSDNINGTGLTYVNYLFATCAGVQYINSYVGDGTTGRTINCGFTGGARFVCIKATSTSGSWWTFDSARGIVTNSDPALQLNSTAAEVTSADAIDTASSGFIVNQEATCSLNASGVSYLVWAIA